MIGMDGMLLRMIDEFSRGLKLLGGGKDDFETASWVGGRMGDFVDKA